MKTVRAEPYPRESVLPATPESPKILLYSHDTVGLGNIRRTLLLAETLAAQYPRATLLIVTGSPMIHAFRIPRQTDYIKLPCLDRTTADRYEPSFLKSRDAEVGTIRRGVLHKSVVGFDPDLMIVDKRPGGVGGELLETLATLGVQPCPPRLVVAIRDILDEPQATRDSLRRTRDMRTISRYYDEVWIYGERKIFDPIVEYRFPPDVAQKTHFCGYLKRPTAPTAAPNAHNGPPRVLLTTGGGADGTALIETYLEGLLTLPRRVALQTTVVFGPAMPEDCRLAVLDRYGSLPDVRFVDFEPDLSARYAEADAVVSMAGYNTVCELLSWDRPALLVPRAQPVREQLLRARLLAARGVFDYIEPDDLQPGLLIERVLATLTRPRPSAAAIDLDGLRRVGARVDALLQATV